VYVALARRFNWTEAQIDATDPDLIDELLIFVRAEADAQEQQNRRQNG